MVTDPYEVLGVSKDATPEEIKSAYRKKAKQYHPDLHPNDPTAAQKMNEVNEAYDMLTNPGKYAQRAQQHQQQGSTHTQQGSSGSQQQNGSYGRYQGPGGWSSDFDFGDFFWASGDFGGRQQQHRPQTQAKDSSAIRQVIDEINSGDYSQADQHLNMISGSERNARWYYLSGLAHNGMGNTIQAVEQMQKAVQMDPGNDTYQQLLRSFQRAEESYQQSADQYAQRQQNIRRLCLGICCVWMVCWWCRCC